jgi:hypothetical protein
MKKISEWDFAFASALTCSLGSPQMPVQARSAASVDAILGATIQFCSRRLNQHSWASRNRSLIIVPAFWKASARASAIVVCSGSTARNSHKASPDSIERSGYGRSATPHLGRNRCRTSSTRPARIHDRCGLRDTDVDEVPNPGGESNSNSLLPRPEMDRHKLTRFGRARVSTPIR